MMVAVVTVRGKGTAAPTRFDVNKASKIGSRGAESKDTVRRVWNVSACCLLFLRVLACVCVRLCFVFGTTNFKQTSRRNVTARSTRARTTEPQPRKCGGLCIQHPFAPRVRFRCTAAKDQERWTQIPGCDLCACV